MQTTLDGARFRRIMSRFATGVTVVTTSADGQIHGMTCNAFCSISMTPFTVMVCLAKNSRTERLIEKSGVFAVNILSDSQTSLSDRFAGRNKEFDQNRFNGFSWRKALTGSPIFEPSLAYLDCKLMKSFDGTTHTIYLGEVITAEADENQRPLIFYESRYTSLDSSNPLAKNQDRAADYSGIVLPERKSQTGD
jgi:flavin reductase (DIM6/NTAB) family NADH-FMN oxidoreductase RutF